MRPTVQINLHVEPEIGETLKRVAETLRASEGRRVTYGELIHKAVVATYGDAYRSITDASKKKHTEPEA